MNWTPTRKAGVALALTLGTLGVGASPALAVQAGLSADALVVVGDATADDITITSPGDPQTFVVGATNAAVTPTTQECLADTPAPGQVTCSSPLTRRITVSGEGGNDTITNETAVRSFLDGGVGDDNLTGGSGNDTIFGDTGLDVVNGRAGDDRFFMRGSLVDTVTCGDGNDFAVVDDSDIVAADCEQIEGRTPGGVGAPTPPPVTPTPPTGTPTPPAPPAEEPRQVFPDPVPGACDPAHKRDGTEARNRLFGTRFGDVLQGFGGNDLLIGRGGGDCLYGGEGNDRLFGVAGPDFLKGDPGSDRLDGGTGRDRLAGDPGRDLLLGRGGADLIAAGAGNDVARGGSGADVIGGGGGNDRIGGGTGEDRLFGGRGRDIISAVDGRVDVVSCGPGRDVARVDRRDRLTGCEAVTRVRR